MKWRSPTRILVARPGSASPGPGMRSFLLERNTPQPTPSRAGWLLVPSAAHDVVGRDRRLGPALCGAVSSLGVADLAPTQRGRHPDLGTRPGVRQLPRPPRDPPRL